MLLERNRMAFISKRTNNIRVRYYFIKEWIAVGDIVVKHCTTREMLTDHFTKPLQGSIFRKFRAEIQGIHTTMNDGEMGWDTPGNFNVPPKEGDTTTGKPSTQECVGKYLNNVILIAPSTNVGDRGELGVKSCLVRIRNSGNNIRQQE